VSDFFETLREAGVDMPNETTRLEALEVKGSLPAEGER
jgi:hypothetical protein